jgi:hypothetical protein
MRGISGVQSRVSMSEQTEAKQNQRVDQAIPSSAIAAFQKRSSRITGISQEPQVYSSSLSSSASSSHSKNCFALILIFLLVARSTYFLLAFVPQDLASSSSIRSSW